MYLENNLCEGMYTQNRVDLLSLLTSQVCFYFIFIFAIFVILNVDSSHKVSSL